MLPTESDTTPIATIPHPASVTLFGRGGNVQTADLPSVRDSLGCMVAPLTAAPPPHAWSIGFVGGVVTPLAVDSAASIDHADSAVFVVSLNRLASSLPNDPAGRFAGLPFVVQSLWRFSVADGPDRRRRLARAANQSGSDAASGANACRRRTTRERHVADDGLRRALVRSGGNDREPRAPGRGSRSATRGRRPSFCPATSATTTRTASSSAAPTAAGAIDGRVGAVTADDATVDHASSIRASAAGAPTRPATPASATSVST